MLEEIKKEMFKRFDNCVKGMVGEDYSTGYKEGIQHFIDDIREKTVVSGYVEEMLNIEKYKLIGDVRRLESYHNDPEIMCMIPFNVEEEISKLNIKITDIDNVLNSLAQNFI